MIRSIVDLSRDEVENLGNIGFTKATPFHYDVCMALQSGKTQAQVAEDFNIDDKSVRRIKAAKCPACGHSHD